MHGQRNITSHGILFSARKTLHVASIEAILSTIVMQRPNKKRKTSITNWGSRGATLKKDSYKIDSYKKVCSDLGMRTQVFMLKNCRNCGILLF